MIIESTTNNQATGIGQLSDFMVNRRVETRPRRGGAVLVLRSGATMSSQTTNNATRENQHMYSLSTRCADIRGLSLRVLRIALLAAGFNVHSLSRADMVTDWNVNLEKAAKVAAQLPPIECRIAAIVQTAVFEAANGIAQKYEPYLVSEKAPPGARADAAVAQAAYTALKALYPAQA